jgi:hypothetical protein
VRYDYGLSAQLTRSPGGVARFLTSGCFAATRRRQPAIVAQLRFEFHYSYEGYFLNILATALSTSCIFFCEFFSFKVPCPMPRQTNSLALTS